MMKYLFVLGWIFLGFVQTTQAQADKLWKTLADIEWNNYYDETLGFDVSQPVFADKIKQMEGKEITIKGYIVPVESDKMSVLSAFPYSNCFFCGGAGPETVIELEMPHNRKLINKFVTVKGQLKLNPDDFYSLIYRLKNAKVIAQE